MSPESFFIFIYIILGVLIISNGFLVFYILKMKKRLDGFLRKGEQDIGNVLTEQIKKVENLENNLQKISERATELEKISKKTFQKIGIKRFNPFSGVGSNQSFSIALLDSQNNGFVLTSHYSRDFNRVYAKPIENGKSQYQLSTEEKQAIEQAIKI